MLLFLIAAVGLYRVPGFDVVRYEWSERLPLLVRIIAVPGAVPCSVRLGWIMRVVYRRWQ